MNAVLLLTALGLATPGQGVVVRDSKALAPSLPVPSKKEQAQIARAIDRFIDYETGKLPKKETARALADFYALGPEATFQLIEGLNRAANIESSCPAVIIAQRLARILRSTKDLELLEFARENIGAGVTARRHMNVLKDLKLACQLRKAAIQRENLALGFGPTQKGPGQMSVSDLASAAGTERGVRLKAILVEISQRQGEKVLDTLGIAAAGYDADTKQLAQKLLVSHLMRKGAAAVRQALHSDQPQVRIAAARVAGTKRLAVGGELIALLEDPEAAVRAAARQALVQISRGQDYGPEATAGETERTEAIRQWRAWWDKQARR